MRTLEPDTNPLRPLPVPWKTYADWVTPQWDALLASDPEEAEVQKFLEANPSYLPGVNEYGSGHHSPHGGVLITQPKLNGLDTSRFPDFMWIGATSGVVTPVLIEIEKPGKRWFIGGGVLSADFNQAHGQLAEWQAWFQRPENEVFFRRTYLDWIWDFNERPLAPHYILIYGRRAEFAEDHTGALVRRRQAQKRPNEEFMTYDRLTLNDHLSDVVTARMTDARKLQIRALQPCFTTGPSVRELAARSVGVDKAIGRVPLWTDERRRYVAERWHYWSTQHQDHSGPVSMLDGE